VKGTLIRLGAQLAEENNAAADLWSWLPSHQVAEKHHGVYTSEHVPCNRDVLQEAVMYLIYLKHPEAFRELLRGWNEITWSFRVDLRPKIGQMTKLIKSSP
jgi:hypothetical protein